MPQLYPNKKKVTFYLESDRDLEFRCVTRKLYRRTVKKLQRRLSVLISLKRREEKPSRKQRLGNQNGSGLSILPTNAFALRFEKVIWQVKTKIATA